MRVSDAAARARRRRGETARGRGDGDESVAVGSEGHVVGDAVVRVTSYGTRVNCFGVAPSRSCALSRST